MKSFRPDDIFEFNDPREFLLKLLSEKKSGPSDTRLTTLAKRAGYKSPASISMFLNGRRRLTRQSALRIAQAIRLKGRAKEYFLAMVAFHDGKSKAEKISAHEVMLNLQGNVRNSLDGRQFKMLSQWHYLVLYVMAGLRDINWDVDWISKHLRYKISSEELKAGVADLLSLGLIRYENGVFVKSANVVTAGEEVRNEAVYKYHKQMNQLSDAALDLPLEVREFNGLTLDIPVDKIQELKSRIRTFRISLMDWSNMLEAKNEEIYQVNIQAFPLTKFSEGAV